jgi:peptide/nickel transport system substrate-binding protein
MRSFLASLVVLLSVVHVPAAVASPEGQMTFALQVSLAPVWFDPAETTSTSVPFIVLYAVHDALVKAMPGQPMAPSLAESWSVSRDSLVYEFVLRKGVKFHNGEPVTTEDVKFSFERYRGTAASAFKARIAAVEVVDAQRVRFRLKQPWPDFMTYYGTPATGAGWIVPKKYLEKVGDEGFKRAPIGAGPYKFVAFNPGVELVLEANGQYWRKTPSVKTLVFRAVPDSSTRLAMLKRGEADVAFTFRGVLAEEVRRTPGLTLKAVAAPVTEWLYFAEQWDPKSPWSDRRVRLAANLAIDRQALNEAETLGLSRVTASIIPRGFDFAWPAPLYEYDPARAKQLLAEAGYPNGLDAGTLYSDVLYAPVAETIANYFRPVGIRMVLQPIERAGFFKVVQEKRVKNVILIGSGALGNAATRLEAWVAPGGTYVYGSYSDIEELWRELPTAPDQKSRGVLLERIQRLVHDKAMFAPIWEFPSICAHGPRVAESGLGLIANYPFSAPYEDLKLKAK